MFLKADMWMSFLVGVMSTLTVFGLGFGYFYKKLFKKEQEKNVDQILEAAKASAKAESDSKSLAELIADRPDLLSGGTKGDPAGGE